MISRPVICFGQIKENSMGLLKADVQKLEQAEGALFQELDTLGVDVTLEWTQTGHQSDESDAYFTQRDTRRNLGQVRDYRDISEIVTEARRLLGQLKQK